MKQLLRLLIITVLLGSLYACESEPVEETVWDDQIKTMDKARAVEDEMMQRAEQLAKQLEGIDQDEKDPPR